ncbi:MAG: ATP-dependent RecD-like DNA helicase [Parachlamydiaceae bacterium]|nr:ATP-dependent RecD-like DNA helicase [Parachlamydiaceae bacterium]
MDQIFGYVERITFQNSENGYTVAQLKIGNKSDLTCIVGCMPGLQPGETIRCFGQWKNHLVHGKQFEVSSFRVEAPADIVGIKKYLGSGLVKGIGPKYANRIVEKFGVETLTIIDQFPERLKEIQGLGAKRIGDIKKCWTDQKHIRDVMVFLQTYGVTPSFAQKIFKTYGDQSIAKVKENPFRLAQEIFGIGFKTADTIAQKMGIAKDADRRIEAGIEHVLSQLSGDGHVCYPVDEFLKEAEQVLEASIPQIEARLQFLHKDNRIEMVENIEAGKKRLFLWSKSLYVAETGIARELRRLKKAKSQLRQIDTDKAVEWVQEQLKIQLAPNQMKAVAQAISGKIQIITGGPGTGKSTITKAILAITEKLTDKIILAAPTGRAAKRMTEITGKKASTIHSLLEFNFKGGGFKRNRESPLDCNLIIIDEASMIDTYLMYSLLKAIPDHARVIFVGDIHQLPSVGPGNVLKDMIGSRSLSVTTLNEIFRQAAGSSIITNAHRINNGTFPTLYNGQDSDFFFIDCQEGEEVLNTILKLVSQRLPKRYGFNPLEEIQVLAPMKKGIIGTENLNIVLQQILNPNQTPLTRGGTKYHIGDKVMQIRNNYKKEIFNGDIGIIKDIDMEEQTLIVIFDKREVLYEFSDLDELVLAYAISIHKFQGSECPCVVMPVHTSHFMLLHRNLLYTGITRGKKLVILVGTKKAIAIAVKNDEVQKRYTALQQAIMEIL